VIAVVGVWAAVGGVLIAAGGRLRHRAFLVAATAPAVTLAWVATRLGRVVDGRTPTSSVPWVGGLDLSLDLRLDGLGATMVLVVAGIGLLVLLYSAAYFEHHGHDLARLAGLLVLFGGSMVGLVLADHLLALYAFWEATTVTSYLLIGHDHRELAARQAALQAVIVTGAGGLAMLGGFVLLGQTAGTYRLSELGAAHPSGATVTAALALVAVGAFTKSAQYPFHAWLPSAMAAPTPVSTYLHAATMVKAGVFLVARLAPVFAVVGFWRPLVLTVGALSLVGGGIRALHQDDLKLLLAYGTVSQLGFMMLLFGAGTPALTAAGWDLLVAHALFKSALFMVVGLIDTATGTRDARAVPVLAGRRWRWVEATTAAAAVSMAGIPLGVGFVAKEAAYDALAGAPFGARWWLLAAVVAGSMLTVAYSFRFLDGAFLAPRRRRRASAPATPAPAVPAALGPVTAAGSPAATPSPSTLFVVPPAIVAAGGVVLGVAPHLADPLVTATVRHLGARGADVHLAVWHGPTLALWLTALTLAGGAAVAWARDPVRRLLDAAGRLVPSADAAFRSLLRGLGTASRRVTGVVQNGSLPVYAGVVLATAALLPAVVLFAWWSWPAGTGLVDHAADVPITALLAAAALGAATIRRRLSAALLLGTAGYAMAALFVLYGAPDLALTQVAIETLSTVLFVLVLRRLPDRFERQASPRRRVVRIAVAAGVGAMVFVFALAAAGSHPGRPFATGIVDRAVPDGGGRNVVNVVLVDFRALDTMVEITVLAAASIGAVALARAGRLPRSARTSHPLGGPGATPREAPAPAGPVRIVFVDVTLRIVFYAVLMVALWLLFAGHNQPGGGFVAGLLAGSAVSLQFIAGGMPSVLAISRFRPWTVLGGGLLTAAATAALPLAFGRPVLYSAARAFDLPVVGSMKLGSALVFDIGVFVTVVGMVLMVFEAFGDEPVPEQR